MFKPLCTKILCIEDGNRTNDWIRIMLRANKLDCEIRTVSTGREVFRLMNRERFDLLLLDYTLPDMSGVQLCSLLRRAGSLCPIVFFSSLHSPVQKNTAMAAGADAFLSKPGDLDVFSQTVLSLLHRRRMGDLSRSRSIRAAEVVR